MGALGWLLQWPIRALVLLVVAALPLGVELASFGTALWACLGDYLAGWVDLAGVVSVQLDHRGHLVWLGRLADSGLSPQKRFAQCCFGCRCVQRDQCRGVARPWHR